jgi:hypothetical protein
MLHFDKDTKKMNMIVKDTGSFALNITNYTLDEGDEVVFTINTERELETPVIQKRVTDFSNGKAVISLTATDTDVAPGNYLYDVQINGADGRVDTVIGPARFKFEGGVTY